MTRQSHDQFAKEYLEELLTPFGTVEKAKNVKSETREIDLFFTPNNQKNDNIKNIGVLENFTKTTCLIEPFRNPCTSIEIRSCLLKLYTIHGETVRKANRDKVKLSQIDFPLLWILTPTCSKKILENFGATLGKEENKGVYFLPKDLYTRIVVIHQLPINQDTLWLRILGKSTTQKQAVEELVNLPKEVPFKANLLELLANWYKNLELRDNILSKGIT